MSDLEFPDWAAHFDGETGRTDQERLADIEQGLNQTIRTMQLDMDPGRYAEITAEAQARAEATLTAAEEAAKPENIARAQAHERINGRTDAVYEVFADAAAGHAPDPDDIAACTDGDRAAVARIAQEIYRTRLEGRLQEARRMARDAAHSLADHGTMSRVPPPPPIPTDPEGLAALVPRW